MLKKARGFTSLKANLLKTAVIFLTVFLCVSFTFNADTEEILRTNISNSYKLHTGDMPTVDAESSARIPKADMGGIQTLIGPQAGRDRPRPERVIDTVGHYEALHDLPHIDLDTVPKDAYEPGIISIKLTPDMRGKSISNLITAGKEGYAITNIAELDELNQLFGIQKYENNFHHVYEKWPETLKFKERHEYYGFDLWYLLTLDRDADVIEAVKRFQQISIIEKAEPVYKKMRILPTSESESNNSSENQSLDTKFTPNDPYFSPEQWHFYNYGQTIGLEAGTAGCDISAREAWDIETGLSDVIVAVFDGGIDYQHPDLNANMWPDIGPDGTSTVADNHGTHTAGTIAAVTNNSVGVAGVAGGSGTGNGARLMSIDIFDSDPYSFRDGNTYAVANGAAISSNSWSYTNPGVSNSFDLDAIDHFNADGGGDVMLGGLTVFAAGNHNDDDAYYPGYYYGAMAVAGTDNRDQRYTSSNYGYWVEIAAPAVMVYSTRIRTNSPAYIAYSGTSMACPHVSGVGALVVSYLARNDYIITAPELRQLLKDTTDYIDDLNPGYGGQLGTGRLNAHEALIEAQIILGNQPAYSVNLSNLTGNRYLPVGDTIFYKLRVWNRGSLNDAYFFDITGGWTHGLYTDQNGNNPLTEPLILDSMEQAVIYLKVTVPPGTPFYTVNNNIVKVTGTWVSDSVTITTIASSSIFFEDFEDCDHDWTYHQLNAGYNGDGWQCEEVTTSGIDGMIHYKGNDGTNRANSYIVSPQISIPSDGETYLSFYSAYRLDGGTFDTHAVRISRTTNDPSVLGAFALLEEITNDGDEGSFYKRTIDLTAYAGEDVYLAFVYRGTSTSDIWVFTYVDVYQVFPYALPFYEDYHPAQTTWPSDWSFEEPSGENLPIWFMRNSNEAGGEPYEMALWWGSWTGETRAITPEIILDGASAVRVSFKHFYSDWSGLGTLVLKVQYSTDGSTWIDAGFYMEGGQGNNLTVGPETISMVIPGLGSEDSVYICWHSNGNHDLMYYWCIDDILIEEAPQYDVQMTNESGNKTINIGETEYYKIRVNNTGYATDNYYFTYSGPWTEGLYLDESDTAIPVPLTIASDDHAYVYLKVRVPLVAGLYDTRDHKVEVTGSGSSYDSVEMTTTAVHFYLFENFIGCEHTGWTLFQRGNATNNWVCYNGGYMYHEEAAGTGKPVARSWLISPQLSITDVSKEKEGAIYLYFWTAYLIPAGTPAHTYQGHYLLISDVDNPQPGGSPGWGDFTLLDEIVNTGMEEGYFYEKLYDITAYAGKDIHIAFKYYGDNRGDFWAITNVLVFDEGYYVGPAPEYTLTLTVEDQANNPLPSMNVWVWPQGEPSNIIFDGDTNASGQIAASGLLAGRYDYDIFDYYQQYDYYTGNVIIGADTNITVNLDLTDYTVLFEILDMEGAPIEGALIDIDGVTNPPLTGSDGKTSTTLTFGTYNYSVSEACYQTINTYVDIAMYKNAVSREQAGIKASEYHLLHQMTEAGCKVTFSVSSGSEPVMGARIDIDGSPDPVITDSSGYGETYLTCGIYDFMAEAGNYKPYYSNFSVEGTEEKGIIEVELDYDEVYIQPAISLGHPSHTGIWLWEYNEAKPSDITAKGSTWTNILQGVTAKKILAGDITDNGEIELIALLEDYGLWYYSIQGNIWTVLIPDPDICIDFTLARTSADGPIQIIASLKDHGIYKWDHAQGNIWPSSWQSIVRAPADILIADNITRHANGIQELAITFHGYAGLYFYSFETNTFSRITSLTPSQITKADVNDDGFNELIIVFDGYGVYLAKYEPSIEKGLPVPDVKYPLFDIVNDIPKNNEWTSKGSDTGLLFTRITWGTPDAGHYIGTGDIKLGFGEEIFMTHSGYTYYYSADAESWAVLAYAPLKRIISGRFTGYVRGDLIVCDSNTGNIFIYRTKTHSWELLVAGGNTNAMAPVE